MIELLYLAAYASAAYCTGNFFLSAAKARFRSFGEEAVFSQALGLIIFSYATFALGLLGLLHSGYFRIMLALLLLLFFKRIKKAALYLWQSIRQRSYKLKFDNALVMLIASLAALNLFAALAPVHSSDAIAHHIALPKIYAEQHRITSIPDIIPSNYPLAVNMLFLDGYLIESGELSELIAAYIGLLLALAIYFFCARYFTKRTGLAAAAIFYTLPIFSLYNIRGFVDIATGLYSFLAIYAFFIWHEREGGWLALSAAAAGFAAATKTSAIIVPTMIGIFLAYDYAFIKKRITLGIVAYGTVAAAMVMPWLIRAFVNTGNPFYPLFYNIFGGAYINAVVSQYWVDALRGIGFGTGVFELIKLPWNVTMHSTAFRETLGTGPVFLAFIPALLLIKKADAKIKALLLMAAAFTLAWFFTAQVLRYIFVVYAMLAVVTGYVINRMLKERQLRAAAAAGFAIIMVVNLAIWAGANSDELKAAAGLQSRENFLQQKVSNYNLLRYANENLEGARICLYGDIRGYYSDNEYVGCHPAWQGYIDFSRIDSGEALLGRLKELRVTHILVQDFMFTQQKDFESWNVLVGNGNAAVMELTANATLIYEDREGKLYKI